MGEKLRPVAITGVGLVTALGTDLVRVRRALAAGKTGVRPATDERSALPIVGVAEASVDVRPLLKRRKDRKLLPRAAELALVAAAAALAGERHPGTGLFLGVGREAADQGETEPSLLACNNGGRFDVGLLAGPGLAAYPPLAPLKTLPNLVLAHVAIQLQLNGPGATRAGGESAGLAAIIEGVYAVAEERCAVALAGGADSLVDAGSARDRVRMGWIEPPPGEGAALMRLELLEAARKRGAPILGVITAVSMSFGEEGKWFPPWVGQLGALGAAAAPVAIALQLPFVGSGALETAENSGARARLEWQDFTAC